MKRDQYDSRITNCGYDYFVVRGWFSVRHCFIKYCRTCIRTLQLGRGPAPVRCTMPRPQLICRGTTNFCRREWRRQGWAYPRRKGRPSRSLLTRKEEGKKKKIQFTQLPFSSPVSIMRSFINYNLTAEKKIYKLALICFLFRQNMLNLVAITLN